MAQYDLDQLARRAVDTVMRLVGRGINLARGVLLFTVVACVGGFLLGVAALSDGIETVWILLGGFFASLALASAVSALRRLRAVRRSADSLVTEVRALIAGNAQHERVVIETVESADNSSNDGIVVLSRQFSGLGGAIGDRVGEFRSLATAIAAVTSFPGLVAVATVVSFVFLGLGLIFLLALAL